MPREDEGPLNKCIVKNSALNLRNSAKFACKISAADRGARQKGLTMHAKRMFVSEKTKGAFGIDWIVLTANAVGLAIVVTASSYASANQSVTFNNKVIAKVSEQ